MRAILKNRICMDDLANRRNPFVNLGSHEYMMVACDALLNNGTITRSDLADKFTSVFGWSKKTANSHVGVVFAVLEHYGVIA